MPPAALALAAVADRMVQGQAVVLAAVEDKVAGDEVPARMPYKPMEAWSQGPTYRDLLDWRNQVRSLQQFLPLQQQR